MQKELLALLKSIKATDLNQTMSRKYKFYDKEGLYFVSFATIHWIDIFVRELYFNIILESLKFCRENKRMEIYAWCIMPSHVHLIYRGKDSNPGDILRDLKTHTSKQMQKEILENPHESRREWIIEMMEKAGANNSNVKHKQFWQQNNNPIQLWSPAVIDQKVDYIHNNPVEAGFVFEPYHWKYSSAIDYSGGKGLLQIDYV
ncbi:MAG: REP-associated tyrosine transposase [Candidatus Cyclobacteriaceae bacterium M2_1C_046]